MGLLGGRITEARVVDSQISSTTFLTLVQIVSGRMLDFLLLMLRQFLSLFGLSKRIVLVHHSKPAKLVRLDAGGEKVVTGLEEVLAGCRSLSGRSAWFTPTAWLSS